MRPKYSGEKDNSGHCFKKPRLAIRWLYSCKFFKEPIHAKNHSLFALGPDEEIPTQREKAFDRLFNVRITGETAL